MTPSLSGAPRRRAALPVLAALGLAALAPSAARAQTQDLFVSNQNRNTISRFAGTGPGTFSTTATTLSAPSLNAPIGLAFDARGNLFAADNNGILNTRGSITEFAFNSGTGTFGAGSTFATGGTLNNSAGLAFDSLGNLFAANITGILNTRGSITEFAFNSGTGTFGAGSTLATGGTLNNPQSLAFDARGDLFATNFSGGTNSGGTITEFAFTPGTNGTAGTFGTGTTVETGLGGPIGLAFGPSAPPAVPEASTTVSLGLLLMLGMGGMVIAARKKRRA